MLEINIQMIVGFITLCWIITRLAVFLLKKEFNILRELQLILVYICLVVIARMVLLPLHLVNGHLGTIVFDASRILPFWMNLKPFTFVNDFYDGWKSNSKTKSTSVTFEAGKIYDLGYFGENTDIPLD